MNTIYKYPFEIADEVRINMHTDAELLHVAVQDGQPCLWALVDTNRSKVDRWLRIRGTGHDMHGADTLIFHNEVPYIGTLHVGALVFHVFDGWEIWK